MDESVSPPVHIAPLLAEMREGVLIVDVQRRILESNPAAGRMLSARDDGLVGKSLLEAMLSYEVLSLFTSLQKTGTAQQQEVKRNGETGRTLLVRLLPLHPPRPKPAVGMPFCLVLIEDVTELRRLETIRRDFVANVSHELRTPLASIRAMAETLQDGAIEDVTVAERFVRIIVGEVERLTRILEDLLILSRAESHLPERVPFALDALIYSVVERLQTQADKTHLALTVSTPSPLTVVANRDLIEQVLVNLVDNAIKYTSEGGRVEVRATQQERRVTVSIIDTGIGIMSQDLPRIFERFYRVDKARSRQSGGTGLGLSIVKHIIETHGGQVTVESEYGRGSTFSFFLPVRPSEMATKMP
jgi:two-component system, OmpR family, phosphate regulon sensor histidine kinase PhoR